MFSFSIQTNICIEQQSPFHALSKSMRGMYPKHDTAAAGLSGQ